MLSRLLRAAAAGLTAAADVLESQPEAEPTEAAPPMARLDPDPERMAAAIIAEHAVRDALHRALRKYSPTEAPAEA